MAQQTLKRTLLGSFEIFLMMPSATDHFTAERQDAYRSFLYPALLYPLVLWAFSLSHHVNDATVFAAHALVSWMGLFAFYGIVYWITNSIERKQYFWQFVSMANALYIVSFILLIPIFLTLAVNGGPNEFFQHYWIFYILVNIAFTAFVANKALRLNWFLGLFMANLSLIITDVGNKILLS